MHEAISRPPGESLGEFIWRRGIEYFDIQEIEDSHRRLLPDCRKDDSLAEDFLKSLRKTMVQINR